MLAFPTANPGLYTFRVLSNFTHVSQSMLVNLYCVQSSDKILLLL